jgi:hypothetical protein
VGGRAGVDREGAREAAARFGGVFVGATVAAHPPMGRCGRSNDRKNHADIRLPRGGRARAIAGFRRTCEGRIVSRGGGMMRSRVIRTE